MSTPTFSLLHATYGRPVKAIAAMRMALERAAMPEGVEYIFAVNNDDESRHQLLGKWMGAPFRYVYGDFPGSAAAWDAAAKVSTGKILVQMSDDMELPDRWDHAILNAIHGCAWSKDWEQQPFVIAVAEHYRHDDLLTMAICNRARYEQQGHFIYPGYTSMFSDDEFSCRAYADAADGLCVLIKAPQIVVRHENPYHTGAPQDNTLLRQNSPEAYAQGQRLFVERNHQLLTRGFRTWK